MAHPSTSPAFTLIELLVVIAIIAILSVVVITTLNPIQLLTQSRDSNRLSDFATMSTALGIYLAQGGSNLGSSSVIYISIPDPSATSSAGDQCQGLGLISLPATYTYHCAASSTYRNTNGTGWVPINFSSLPISSPVSNLPVDPLNTSSTRNYYTYTTNGSQYEFTTPMESTKYQLGGSNDEISGDGGTLASVYEKGTAFGLEPLDYGDTSLVGLWTFNEGVGSVAYDYSGNGDAMTWSGATWAPGKIGNYAISIGSGQSVTNSSTLTSPPTTAVSIAAWVNVANTVNYIDPAKATNWTSPGSIDLDVYTGGMSFGVIDGSSVQHTALCSPIATSTWVFLVGTYDGSTVRTYLNGVQCQTNSASGISLATTKLNITVGSGGSMTEDDLHIYNRALSAAQITAMYAGGK